MSKVRKLRLSESRVPSLLEHSAERKQLRRSQTSSKLRQLTHYFLIQAVLHFFHHTVFLEADDGTRSGLLGTSKHIYELLRLELIRQFTEALNR